MRSLVLAFVSMIGVFGAIAFLHASAQGTNTAQVARGRYLVTQAGKCSDCHGPQLQGAALDFLKPGLPVLYAAPKIAGLPGLSVPAATKFLETGLLPTGKPARPPMPQFRFNPDDAASIAAYLKSLH